MLTDSLMSVLILDNGSLSLSVSICLSICPPPSLSSLFSPATPAPEVDLPSPLPSFSYSLPPNNKTILDNVLILFKHFNHGKYGYGYIFIKKAF